MKREEDWLREACARLAEEDAARLEAGLTPAEISQAEELFRRHRRAALSQIARNCPRSRFRGAGGSQSAACLTQDRLTPEEIRQAEDMIRQHRRAGPSRARRAGGRRFMWLRAAACLMVAAGAVWAVFSQQAPDPTPLTPGQTASVAPFFSPAPTMTATPTLTPEETVNPIPSPTITPEPSEIPQESPTLTPLPTPRPTAEPTTEPTAEPTEAPEMNAEAPPALSGAPEEWTGRYFPTGIPAEYELMEMEEGEGFLSAHYLSGDERLVFTEYDTACTVAVPEGAALSYVALGESGVALRMETEEGVLLAWEMEGRTLSLFGTAAEALPIAGSVKKIAD